MKWASKAKLEIYGDVNALQRLQRIAVAMSEHGLAGHGFSVSACDGNAKEEDLGYWDGHGASSMHRVVLTEIESGEQAESVLMRSIEPDPNDVAGHDFKWIEKRNFKAEG